MAGRSDAMREMSAVASITRLRRLGGATSVVSDLTTGRDGRAGPFRGCFC